nr:hydrogen peroxide-inducible genes activator [Segnochrobactrum spirostomi]
MKTLPTVRQMQYFVALADKRSFSKAAAQCHVTQSTLSAAIRAFEEALDSELVDRSGRGVVLTEAGEAVLDRVRLLLADVEALAGVAKPAALLAGKMRLGVIPSIAPFLLPRALPSLRASFPDLKLLLREGLTRTLVEDLRAGRIDAVLVAHPYGTEGLETASVGFDRFLFAASRRHPLARRNSLCRADIAEESLLLLEDGHCLRQHVLAATGAQPRARDDIEASSLTTLVQMVDNGFGVTLLPRIAVDGGITAGTDLALVPFEDERAARELVLAWRKRSNRGEEFRVLARHLAQFVEAVEPDGPERRTSPHGIAF